MIRFAFVADDFTGAIDALWQYRRFGLRSALIVDSADLHRLPDDLDVIGVATTLRSLPADEIEQRSAPLLDALVRTGAAVVQYKVCSTFDSSPDVGSIGRVIDVARGRGDLRRIIPVMPAQPELGRYTVFGHHFARYGDGRIYRIDRHPVMRRHPITPARDSDLIAVISTQTDAAVIDLPTRAVSEDDIRRALRAAEADEDVDAVVLDVLDEGDAIRLGSALNDAISAADRPLFAVGSGGLSWALARALTGKEPASPEPAATASGPVLALSGSRSPITASQIDAAEAAGWPALDLVADEEGAVARARAALASGRSVVVYASRGASEGEQSVDDAGARLARAAAACLDEPRLARLVIMGGDTSGEVLKALGVTSIELRTMIPPALPLCVVTSTDPRVQRLEVAVKGGQLGGVDYLVEMAQPMAAIDETEYRA